MAARKPDNQIDISKLSFEQALEHLGSIVADIEQGKIGLEESIRQYELGCKLIQHSRGILDQAERKIQTLSKSTQGKLQAADTEIPQDQEPDPADQQ